MQRYFPAEPAPPRTRTNRAVKHLHQTGSVECLFDISRLGAADVGRPASVQYNPPDTLRHLNRTHEREFKTEINTDEVRSSGYSGDAVISEKGKISLAADAENDTNIGMKPRAGTA